MSEQFKTYQRALKSTGRTIPRLVIDLDTLDQNIAALRKMIAPDMALRLVVKSLPAIGLLEYLRQKLNTDRLMVFHQPFLSELSAHLAPAAPAKTDVLLGKPMPVDTAAYYFEQHQPGPGFAPFDQVQWLVDAEERLLEYLQLARQLSDRSPRKLRINLELDVGLRRGGFADSDQLRPALALLRSHQDCAVFSGFMGYDPHVVKIPGILRSRQKLQRSANQAYLDTQDLVREEFPELWRPDLTFNGAGSPTLALHRQDSPLSEVAAGSAFLKPTTFDLPTLRDLRPACFIAAPVLKTFPRTTLPALEFLPSNQPSCFIYGGYWKADFHYPKGARNNKLFGSSTNQSLINLPRSARVEPGDYLFLRPQQSEFVLLQFGDILAVRGDQVVAEWPCLRN